MPRRCAQCKKWDWDEGKLSRNEKRLRRDLLKIEVNEMKYRTIDGTGLYPIPTDICATFLRISPRPTEEELKTVLNPICYLGPYDYNHHSHNGTCSDQAYCCPGWRPEKSGVYYHDRKLEEDMMRIEKDVRHKLMQQIIDSRGGIVNTNSTHYRYLENKKLQAESLSRFDPLEMLASKG